jgi:hypothetical protein
MGLRRLAEVERDLFENAGDVDGRNKDGGVVWSGRGIKEEAVGAGGVLWGLCEELVRRFELAP